MALDTKGTAHIFGIRAGTGAVTDATVQSFSKGDSKQNISQTLNELGNEIEYRSDDVVTEVSMGLRIRSGYAEPEVSDVIIYDSIKYNVITIDGAEANGTHVVVTVTARTTEYVALV